MQLALGMNTNRLKFAATMSTYFSQVIKAGGRLREFNFRLLSPLDYTRYRVDVADETGERLLFELHQTEGKAWQLAGRLLPGWAQQVEEALGEAVETHQKTESEKNRQAQ